MAKILIQEWSSARKRRGWAIGRYVIVPDHVHFSAHQNWVQNTPGIRRILERMDKQSDKTPTTASQFCLAEGVLRSRATFL